jgi:hypothetical protein
MRQDRIYSAVHKQIETKVVTRKQMPNDPLLYEVALPLVTTYFPLGFPVRITTNSRDVIEAAEEKWKCCEDRFGVTPLDVRFAVDEDSQSERPPAVFPTGYANLISIVHAADNFAVIDLFRGSSFSWLTPAVVTDRGYFLYHFLEPVVYLLLGALHLAPIHAACVALDQSGVLILGDSGAGKTSLAYACARRGWTYVGDDGIFLVRPGTERKILGRHREIRFRSSATLLFPELAHYPAVQRPNEKLDLELKTADLGFPCTSAEMRVDYLVFLNRAFSGPAGLQSAERCRAEAWLEQVLHVHEKGIREAQRKSLGQLLNLPIFELRYRDPNDGEEVLRSLISHAG